MPETKLFLQNTFVSIGTFAAVVLLAISGYVWLDDKFDMLVDENRAINTKILLIERDFQEIKTNRWTDSKMMKWSNELQKNNPTITVPDVD